MPFYGQGQVLIAIVARAAACDSHSNFNHGSCLAGYTFSARRRTGSCKVATQAGAANSHGDACRFVVSRDGDPRWRTGLVGWRLLGWHLTDMDRRHMVELGCGLGDLGG